MFFAKSILLFTRYFNGPDGFHFETDARANSRAMPIRRTMP